MRLQLIQDRRRARAALFAMAAAALALAGCGSEDEAPEGTALPPVVADRSVVADGIVVPLQRAELSASGGGRVREVLVQEGEVVEAGALLLQLDDEAERAALRQAEAELAAARAQLAALERGASDESIAGAQAAVEAAEASARSAGGQVSSASAALDKLVGGARADEVAIARRRIKSAENLLWGAQAARDGICGRVEDGFAEESDCDRAEAEVGRLHEEIRIAQLQLNDLLIGAAPEDVQAARAQVAQASGSREAAEAQVRQAEAELARLREGSSAEDLAAAEARVELAEAGVQAAEVRLDRMGLRAPFDGEIVALDARLGEQLQPGQVAVRLADTSAWRVETDNLTELSVVDIEPGDPATISIDALPELELQGEVERVRGFGEDELGDIVYTVTIAPEEHEPRLRWNMTAAVRIRPGDEG